MIKDYRYDEALAKDFIHLSIDNKSSDSFIATSLPTGQAGFIKEEKIYYYIGTGEIIDTYSYGKYIFQNNLGEEYILNTDKNYQIGDKLRLVGYQKNVEFIQNTNYSRGFNLSYLQTGWDFDYNKRLIMKGYKGNIYEQNSVIITQNRKRDFSTSLRSSRNDSLKVEMTGGIQQPNKLGFIQNIKHGLQSQIISTYGEGRIAGLIMGMLIGDKSQIPKSDYQTFIDSGLVHLIAVSGGNIIMLIVFLSFILFFLPLYLRNFVILLAIIFYSLLCGMDSSVMRAVLFGGLGMMALFVGRETNFRRSVSLVFILMLLFNPYFLLYDLGFLLSFGAVIGIKIFTSIKPKAESKKQEENKKINIQQLIFKVYNNYIKPSIGANIGIFPVIIFFMGQINLVGFISNLFVLPIVPFVMIYGFISIFLYSLFPRSGFIYIEKVLISYIYKISEIGSDYGIYLLVDDYKIKYLILILFIIGLIIYMIKNKIIYNNLSASQNKSKISIKYKSGKSNKSIKN